MKKLFELIKTYLKEGTTPTKLAITLALGMVIGIMPVVGIATPFATLLALIFRLNIPILLATTYALAPFYLALYYPFLRYGTLLFSGNISLFKKIEALDLSELSWLETFQQLGWVQLYGVGAWLMVAVPLCVILFFFAKNALNRLVARL